MNLPSQTQLMLPLLESIQAAGGVAKPGALYDEIAARLGLPQQVREATSDRADRGEVNLFERRVRWTRQTAIMKGLIDGRQRGKWALTDKANAKLHNCVRGALLTIFETDRGMFLWGSAEDAIGIIERESVDLLMTSPPYALLHPKEYGNLDETQWVDWMLGLCDGWRSLLKPSGSVMLNVGPCWVSGMPAQSLYIERLLCALHDKLGLYLLQRLDWHSPTKMGALKWVGIERIRVTPSVEPMLWLSPNPRLAKADNRNVLRPYSAGGRRAIERDDQRKRPGGFAFGKNSFTDCGGSIPPSLITATPVSGEDKRYRKAVAAAGLRPHPAVMPAAVARFGIQLATNPDDLVYDPFSGSGVVPVEAMKLGRYAIGSDRSLTYIETSMLRCQTEGLRTRRIAA